MRYVRMIQQLALILISLAFSFGTLAASPTIIIETISSVKGTAHDIQLATENGITHITGKVHKSHANKSRRMYGAIKIDLLDADHNLIRQQQAMLHRSSPAKHTHQTSFALAIDQWPDEVTTIRVAY